MKLYDTVKLTEKFAEFDVGTAGVIIELYDNKKYVIKKSLMMVIR